MANTMFTDQGYYFLPEKGDVERALVAYYNHHLHIDDTNSFYYPYDEPEKTRIKIKIT